MENTTGYPANSSLLIPSAPKSTSSAYAITDTFYISLFLMYIPGIVTNFVSIIVLISEARRTKMPMNILLLLLCTTDFVAVGLSCFWHTSKRLGMEMTYELCAVKSFLHPIMPLLTGAISLLMAIDRVLAFCSPFYYRTNVNKKVWFVAVMLTSTFLSVICILPHLGLGSMWTASYRRGKVSYRCSVFTYQEEASKKIFHVIYTSIGFLIVAGIIICNAVVVGAMLLLRHRTIEAQKSRSNQQNVSRATELKFAIIVAALACVFLTCWLPYNKQVYCTTYKEMEKEDIRTDCVPNVWGHCSQLVTDKDLRNVHVEQATIQRPA